MTKEKTEQVAKICEYCGITYFPASVVSDDHQGGCPMREVDKPFQAWRDWCAGYKVGLEDGWGEEPRSYLCMSSRWWRHGYDKGYERGYQEIAFLADVAAQSRILI